MAALEKILGYFAQGYTVYSDSYYGSDLCETEEEIREELEEALEDEYLSIGYVEVDEEAREIHFMVQNDE